MTARAVSWLSPALKAFEQLPEPVRTSAAFALAIAAEGGKADTAKPLRGLGPGIMEIVCDFRGDAFRVICSVRSGQDVWVLHAFQKKSHKGSTTPASHIDLVIARLRRLQGMLDS